MCNNSSFTDGRVLDARTFGLRKSELGLLRGVIQERIAYHTWRSKSGPDSF